MIEAGSTEPTIRVPTKGVIIDPARPDPVRWNRAVYGPFPHPVLTADQIAASQERWKKIIAEEEQHTRESWRKDGGQIHRTVIIFNQAQLTT